MFLYFCIFRVLEKATREVAEEKADRQPKIPKSMSTLIAELDQMTLASGRESQMREKMQMMQLPVLISSTPPQLPMIFSCF